MLKDRRFLFYFCLLFANIGKFSPKLVVCIAHGNEQKMSAFLSFSLCCHYSPGAFHRNSFDFWRCWLNIDSASLKHFKFETLIGSPGRQTVHTVTALLVDFDRSNSSPSLWCCDELIYWIILPFKLAPNRTDSRYRSISKAASDKHTAQRSKWCQQSTHCTFNKLNLQIR